MVKSWQGELRVEGGESKIYEKQEEFIAAIAKAKAVGAEEEGYALTSETSMAGLMYVCMWERPTDERVEEMTQREGYAYELLSCLQVLLCFVYEAFYQPSGALGRVY